mmetsp:Transcript_4788/g.17097  ORF Transcript_4788/g.17097 Transcript_4788/m.17097 type:complete len:357 (+) Transcript_4788:566-1636(+)
MERKLDGDALRRVFQRLHRPPLRLVRRRCDRAGLGGFGLLVSHGGVGLDPALDCVVCGRLFDRAAGDQLRDAPPITPQRLGDARLGALRHRRGERRHKALALRRRQRHCARHRRRGREPRLRGRRPPHRVDDGQLPRVVADAGVSLLLARHGQRRLGARVERALARGARLGVADCCGDDCAVAQRRDGAKRREPRVLHGRRKNRRRRRRATAAGARHGFGQVRQRLRRARIKLVPGERSERGCDVADLVVAARRGDGYSVGAARELHFAFVPVMFAIQSGFERGGDGGLVEAAAAAQDVERGVDGCAVWRRRPRRPLHLGLFGRSHAADAPAAVGGLRVFAGRLRLRAADEAAEAV